MSSSTEDLRAELTYLRDNVVEAARQHRTAVVDNGLSIYAALVETFIDVLSDFDSPYSRAKALAEIHSVGGGWSEIDWIRDDYHEIADAAMSSENFSVIRPVIYFPVELSHLAYAKREYFIFEQFLNWLPYLYGEAVRRLESANGESRRGVLRGESLFGIVRDRLQRYPRELAAQIGADVDDAGDPEAVNLSFQFAEGVLVVFNRLLKSAYDLSRPADFGGFALELQDLYRHEIDETPFPEERIGGDGDSPTVSSARTLSYRNLARYRQVIYLGLDAWILRDYERDRLPYNETQQFRDSLFLPSSLADLWLVYLEGGERPYESELGWSWWEAQEHDDRGVYTGINFDLLLLRPTLLRMLVAATSMPAQSVLEVPLKSTRAVDYLVGNGTGPLIEMLESIASSARLRELARFDPESAVVLRERFIRLAAEQTEQERQRVIEAAISPERVQELRDNISRGWRESGYVRELFKDHDRYELADDPPDGAKSLSVHVWERKDIFVEESRISAHMFGTNWGRALARSGDEIVLETIVAAVPSLAPEAVGGHEVVRYLDEALSLASIAEPLIVLVGAFSARWALGESERFRYSSQNPDRLDGIVPLGYFDQVPVYATSGRIEHLVVIADLAALGIWRQFRPEPSSISEYLDAALLFEFESYTRETARVVLEQDADAFRYEESDGKRERNEDERIAALLQAVRIRVLAQLTFEVMNPDAARVLRLSDSLF